MSLCQPTECHLGTVAGPNTPIGPIFSAMSMNYLVCLDKVNTEKAGTMDVA